MTYLVTTRTDVLTIDADEHAVEGAHHVFRAARRVMHSERLVVVRRLRRADVLSVEPA